MSFKAKTVLNNDIRVFKKDINTIQDAFESLKSFVQQKYELQTPFIIQYEDEEQDLVTIGSSDDLEEAYSQAESNGTVLKLLIVPEEIGIPVYSFTTELDKSIIEKEQEKEQEEEKKPKENVQDSSSSEEEEEEEEEKNEKKKSCPGKKLLQDLNNNEQFRQEFIDSMNYFIQLLKKDFEKLSEQAFQQTLNHYPNINSCFTNEQWKKIFTKYCDKIPLLLLFNFDSEMMGQWINIFIQLFNNCNYHNNNNNNSFPCGGNGLHQLIGSLIPMFMGSIFGGGFPHPPPPPPPPPHHFGYGHSHHGPHHFHHGHGHGHNHSFHHPPPPPPPPFNPLMNLMNMFNLFGANPHGHNFNYPPPPPPPPPGPHSFYGEGCPYKNGGKKSCKKNCKKEKLCKKQEKLEKKEKKCMKKKEKNNDVNDYDVKIIQDDITLAHKGYVLPNQVIVKTWRIKNVGKKDLPNNVSLKYKGKPFNPIINGVNFNVPSLKIGEECDISVVLETPKLNDDNNNNSNEKNKNKNKFKANFKLCLSDGNFFGPLFRVVFFMIDNNDDDNNNNNNMEEKKEEIIVESKPKEEEPQEQVLLNNNNNNNNSSRLNEIEEMDMIDNQLKQEQEQEKLEQDIVPPEDPQPEPESQPKEELFIYQTEVNTLMSMGVQDEQYLRQLLLQHKGNIHQVLNALFN